MSETFTAAIVEKFGPELVIGQLDLPEPGAHQALVKNLASGICHTDLHAAEGDWPVKPEPPFVPGHEGVGEVVAIGPWVSPAPGSPGRGSSRGWSARRRPGCAPCRGRPGG